VRWEEDLDRLLLTFLLKRSSREREKEKERGKRRRSRWRKRGGNEMKQG